MKQRRWLKSAIATAQKTDTPMPWARGMDKTALKARLLKSDAAPKTLRTA